MVGPYTDGHLNILGDRRQEGKNVVESVAAILEKMTVKNNQKKFKILHFRISGAKSGETVKVTKYEYSCQGSCLYHQLNGCTFWLPSDREQRDDNTHARKLASSS